MFLSKSLPRRDRSVREDWFAGLPEDKHQFFDTAVGRLESAYGMLSVALDGAFDLRGKGLLVHAREQAAVSAELLDRLAAQLLEALTALEEQGQRSARLPAVRPLNSEFFRGETARRIAARHRLSHLLLLTKRWRFHHKLRALTRAVEELAWEFRQAAEEIADGTSIHPGACWQALECLHYDLNTCLRETIVVLKSFLLCLSPGQFQTFQRTLEAQIELAARRLRPRFSRVST